VQFFQQIFQVLLYHFQGFIYIASLQSFTDTPYLNFGFKPDFGVIVEVVVDG